MRTVRVQPQPFDPGAEIAAISAGRTDIGGIGCFIGTVRGVASGRTIQSMTLEHYPGMTERALTRVADQAAARWPLLACTLVHRVGRLLPGDPIVLVLTASAHRQAALDATAFLIDWLKNKRPVLEKRSVLPGETAWVTQTAADEAAAARWNP